MIWTKVDLTWREVLEDVGGEILGDDHHLAPGSTQVAILVLVLRRKVLKVLWMMEFLQLGLTTGLYLMLYSVRRELTGGSHWSEMVASCEETKFMFFRSNVFYFNDQSLHLDSKDAQVASWVWQDRCVARLWLRLQLVADC